MTKNAKPASVLGLSAALAISSIASAQDGGIDAGGGMARGTGGTNITSRARGGTGAGTGTDATVLKEKASHTLRGLG